MDESRFDNLARGLAKFSTRRRALGAVAGGLAAVGIARSMKAPEPAEAQTFTCNAIRTTLLAAAANYPANCTPVTLPAAQCARYCPTTPPPVSPCTAVCPSLDQQLSQLNSTYLSLLIQFPLAAAGLAAAQQATASSIQATKQALGCPGSTPT